MSDNGTMRVVDTDYKFIKNEDGEYLCEWNREFIPYSIWRDKIRQLWESRGVTAKQFRKLVGLEYRSIDEIDRQKKLVGKT
jgi:hypothetical protein